MQRGDQIELTILQMVNGGDGMARHEGRVIFVPYTLPGERVRAEITRVKRHWARAALVEVLAPAAERVTPRCGHFGPDGCGGCQWQHASYEAQQRFKSEIVREQLRRIARIEAPPVRPIIGMDEPWHYRNTVQLRPTPGGPGFVRADHRAILPLRECHILNDAVQTLFEQARGVPLPGAERITLRGSARTGERLVLVEGRVMRPLPFDRAVPVAWREDDDPPHPPDAAWHEELADQRWRIGATAFFQVNTRQAERLVALVRELAGPLPDDGVLLDLYAGVGLFGLSVAAGRGHLFLVESDPAAVESARQHAARHSNTTVIEGRSEAVMAQWDRLGRPADLVLLDPPRAGCDPLLIEALGKHPVSTIIYISCDPATQARDIRLLGAQGFQLEIVQPVDLFPQTYHIESVARLRHDTPGRRSNAPQN